LDGKVLGKVVWWASINRHRSRIIQKLKFYRTIGVSGVFGFLAIATTRKKGYN
jgi:hypothetical protein